jgi:long-chain acyl-CoA synthetase
MAGSTGAKWPVMSIAETQKVLTAPGMPFEMETLTIRGIPTRVYKNAPPHLRAVLDQSRQWDDREILVYEGERLTYGDHYRAVSALSRVLTERYGLKKGDRAAIAMRNFPEWSIAFWAAIAIGAVVTPLNAWGTGDDLSYGISDSEAKVAIVDAERLERLRPYLSHLALAGLVAVRTPADQLGSAEALEALIGPPSQYKSLPDTPPPDNGIQPEDDATIFYTSGTTGRPKGALGTHRNIMTNLINVGYGTYRAMLRRGEAIPEPDPNAPQRTMLLPVPFFHVTGCHSVLVPTMAAGGRLILIHRWNPEHALELVEKERINAVTGVPAMMWQLLESPDFTRRDLSSLDGLTYGGAAAAPELTHRIRKIFPNFFPGQGYGATETSSVATANAAEDYQRKPESVGLPPPVNDIMIADENGKEVPRGENGEIWIKGPNVVKGYWNKPEATAAAFTDGWYHTGDVGTMDDEGFVFVKDRIKDMLIRGGENIYCVEIEGALFTHPAVMDAAVVGIPDKVLGEVVGAVVRLKPGKTVSAEELKAHVGKLLSAYKVPVMIDIRTEDMQRNASGKILKNVLREEIAPLYKSA